MVKKYDPDAFHHHPSVLVRFIERRRVKAIFKMMDNSEQDRILEIGCGSGNVIEKASCGKLFGVDISLSILFRAKRRLNPDKTINLIQGDAQNLPCRKQVFRRIICSEVLEHLMDPSEALEEVNRTLTSAGIAIVSVPNELLINRIKSVLIRLRLFQRLFRQGEGYQQMPEKMEDEWHLHAMRLDEWLVLFKKSFRVTRLKRVPFLWLPIRYVVRLEKI